MGRLDMRGRALLRKRLRMFLRTLFKYYTATARYKIGLKFRSFSGFPAGGSHKK